jgi:hypothetical protein
MKYFKCRLLISACLFLIGTKSFSQHHYFKQRAFPIVSHDHKNQLSVSAGWGRGFDLGLSYSLSDHLSLFGSAAINEKLLKIWGFWYDTYRRMNDRFYLSGLKYYTDLKSDAFNRLNLYAAFSSTSTHQTWGSSNTIALDGSAPYTKTHYNSFYIGAEAISEKRKFEAAWTVRYCYSAYNHFEYKNEGHDVSQAPDLIKNLGTHNLETYVSVGPKIGRLKISGQIGMSFPLAKAYGEQSFLFNQGSGTTVITTSIPVDHTAFIARLGIQYNLDFSRKK